MPKESSIDIDDVFDFLLVENIMNNKRLITLFFRWILCKTIAYEPLSGFVVIPASIQPLNRISA